jgi:hypothetical protein
MGSRMRTLRLRENGIAKTSASRIGHRIDAAMGSHRTTLPSRERWIVETSASRMGHRGAGAAIGPTTTALGLRGAGIAETTASQTETRAGKPTGLRPMAMTVMPSAGLGPTTIVASAGRRDLRGR